MTDSCIGVPNIFAVKEFAELKVLLPNRFVVVAAWKELVDARQVNAMQVR